MSELNNKIEGLLNEVEEKGNYTFIPEEFLKDQDKSELYRLILFLIEYGVLSQVSKSNTIVAFTNLGYEIQHSGGWRKYQKRKRFKDRLPIIKDLSLIIIPILTILSTFFLSIHKNESIQKKQYGIESQLMIISNELQTIRSINQETTMRLDSLSTQQICNTIK